MTLDIAALRAVVADHQRLGWGILLTTTKNVADLLDAAEERDRLRASLDVSRYVERTDAFLARAHAAEAQRDALLAAAEDIAMNAVPNFDVYEMAPKMMMRLDAAIAAAKEAT